MRPRQAMARKRCSIGFAADRIDHHIGDVAVRDGAITWSFSASRRLGVVPDRRHDPRRDLARRIRHWLLPRTPAITILAPKRLWLKRLHRRHADTARGAQHQNDLTGLDLGALLDKRRTTTSLMQTSPKCRGGTS